MAVRPLAAGAIAGLLLLAAGCGDDGTTSPTDPTMPASVDTSGTTAASEPAAATTESGNVTTTGASDAATTAPDDTTSDTAAELPSDAPERIVSLSPTHTEILFAIGAGPQVVAVDDQSDYPDEALAVQTDLSGFTPNVEAIAGFEPDLVVTEDPKLEAQLDAIGIDVLVGPSASSFDDAYAQIEQLGAATGHIAEAAELVATMQSDIASIVADTTTSEVPLRVYHELGTELYSADSTTFIGQVYALFGLENIADAASDPSGYPQLNAETIIAANPDLIFLADTRCCDASLETVSARDGWGSITAVAEGNVFAMDDNVASRWGPRIVDYVQQVADALEHSLVAAD